MKTTLLIHGLYLGAAVCLLGTSALAGESKVFDVRKYGAKGDGKTLDTEAIQKALNECGKGGGGTVLLSAGTYLSKPLTLHAKTTLRLDTGAKLQATDEPADFSEDGQATSTSFVPFLAGKNLDGVAILGPGIIDGSGARWWVPAEEARKKIPGYTLPRPNLVVLIAARMSAWKTSRCKTRRSSISCRPIARTW